MADDRTLFRRGYYRVRRGWSRSAHTLALSSDSARMSVQRLWDVGKDVGGSFASERELIEAMGTYRRHIPELRKRGWLDGLDIHDWEEDQRDLDPTAAERQRRRRAKLNSEPPNVTPKRHAPSRRDSARDTGDRHAVTPEPVTVDETVAVTGITRASTDSHTDIHTSTPPSPPVTSSDAPDAEQVPAATRMGWVSEVASHLQETSQPADHRRALKLCMTHGLPATVVNAAIDEGLTYRPDVPVLAYIQAANNGHSSILSRHLSEWNQSASSWGDTTGRLKPGRSREPQGDSDPVAVGDLLSRAVPDPDDLPVPAPAGQDIDPDDL